MNVVIDEPYPEMFTTVEKKVFDKILAFVHSHSFFAASLLALSRLCARN